MELPIDHILIRKPVKHARLKVSEDGKVRIILPENFTDEDLNALLEKKKSWIEKGKRFFEQKQKIGLHSYQLLLYGNRYNYFYDDTYQQKVIIDHDHRTIRAKRDLLDHETQIRWYKSVAKKQLIIRTQELAGKLGFTYNRIFIRNQRTKWGNCSKEGNISLNWRLIKAPLFVIDYLIIHELVHTVISNHSSKFWTLLKSYYPDYKQAVGWLDKYGNSL
jgi:hypothetical protein